MYLITSRMMPLQSLGATIVAAFATTKRDFQFMRSLSSKILMPSCAGIFIHPFRNTIITERAVVTTLTFYYEKLLITMFANQDNLLFEVSFNCPRSYNWYCWLANSLLWAAGSVNGCPEDCSTVYFGLIRRTHFECLPAIYINISNWRG